MFRGFIAIDIKPNDALAELNRRLKELEADLKIVGLENLHITLKFLGNVEERQVEDIKEIIKNASAGVSRFNITLQSVGAFPNLSYINVLWVDVNSGGILEKISEAIDIHTELLGFEREKRGFSPHLTIARVKGKRGKDALKKFINDNKDATFGEQEVWRIVLKKSQLTPEGPVYSNVEEILIGNGANAEEKSAP